MAGSNLSDDDSKNKDKQNEKKPLLDDERRKRESSINNHPESAVRDEVQNEILNGKLAEIPAWKQTTTSCAARIAHFFVGTPTRAGVTSATFFAISAGLASYFVPAIRNKEDDLIGFNNQTDIKSTEQRVVLSAAVVAGVSVGVGTLGASVRWAGEKCGIFKRAEAGQQADAGHPVETAALDGPNARAKSPSL